MFSGINLDKIYDYIPFVSSVTNSLHLYRKIAYAENLPALKKEHEFSYYKSDFRCTLAMVPILGNIIVATHDYFKSSREEALELVKRRGLRLEKIDSKYKSDKEIVLAAVLNNYNAFEFASDSLKKDKEFVLSFIKQAPLALAYVSNDLINDWEVAITACTHSVSALRLIGKNVKEKLGLKDPILLIKRNPVDFYETYRQVLDLRLRLNFMIQFELLTDLGLSQITIKDEHHNNYTILKELFKKLNHYLSDRFASQMDTKEEIEVLGVNKNLLTALVNHHQLPSFFLNCSDRDLREAYRFFDNFFGHAVNEEERKILGNSGLRADMLKKKPAERSQAEKNVCLLLGF